MYSANGRPTNLRPDMSLMEVEVELARALGDFPRRPRRVLIDAGGCLFVNDEPCKKPRYSAYSTMGLARKICKK